MRAPRIRLSWFLSLLITSSASAVTLEWTFIGDPGNAADPEIMWDYTTGYGSVEYGYYIGIYEVTNAQYAEYLNAKAASDPLGLYNIDMFFQANGGINR
ncbi:MAG: PEP-CTERM sorting domain-containing protein, partial [Gammaproteobacteria bacterium]